MPSTKKQSPGNKNVSYLEKWRNLQSSFADVEASMAIKVHELELKEKEVKGLCKKLETLKKEVELKEVKLDERVKEVELREIDVSKVNESVSKRFVEIELKEKQVIEGCRLLKEAERVIDERNRVIEEREKGVGGDGGSFNELVGVSKEGLSEISEEVGVKVEVVKRAAVKGLRTGVRSKAKRAKEGSRLKEEDLNEQCEVLGVGEKEVSKRVEKEEKGERKEGCEQCKGIELERERLEEQKKGLELKEKEIKVSFELVELKEKEVNESVQGLKLIEKEVDEAWQDIELKEKEMRDGFKALELKKKRIDEDRKSLELEKREVDECRRAVDLEKKQLNESRAAIELKVKQFEDSCEGRDVQTMELREKELNEGLEALATKRKQIDDQCTEMEMREKEINERSREVEVKTKRVDERCRALDLREEQLNERCQAQVSKEKEIDEHCRALELKQKQLDEQTQVLESKKKKLYKHCQSLRVYENQLRDVSGSKKLEMKESKEVDITENCQNAQLKGVPHLDQSIEVVGSKDKPSTEASNTSSKKSSHEKLKVHVNNNEIQIRKLCKANSGKALQMFLNERVNEHNTMMEVLGEALKLSNDFPKLILTAVNGFLPPPLEKDTAVYEASATRRSCVLLLEVLLNVKPFILESTRSVAVRMADQWRDKIIFERESDIVVLDFLLFIAAYKLGSSYNKRELERLYKRVAKYSLAPQLCLRLGLSEPKKVSTNSAQVKTAKHQPDTYHILALPSTTEGRQCSAKSVTRKEEARKTPTETQSTSQQNGKKRGAYTIASPNEEKRPRVGANHPHSAGGNAVFNTFRPHKAPPADRSGTTEAAKGHPLTV